MWTFRAYLREKCEDPAFLDRYYEYCTICPRTVLIVQTIRERGLALEQVAKQAGVLPEHLALLESADRCNFEDVQKLAGCLGIPITGACKKGGTPRP